MTAISQMDLNTSCTSQARPLSILILDRNEKGKFGHVIDCVGCFNLPEVVNSARAA